MSQSTEDHFILRCSALWNRVAVSYRHCPTYAIVTFPQVRRKSDFVQVEIGVCMWADTYVKRGPAEMRTPPINILSPPSSHCAFIPTRKNLRVLQKYDFIFFYFITNCVSLKLRKLKLSEHGMSVYVVEFSEKKHNASIIRTHKVKTVVYSL